MLDHTSLYERLKLRPRKMCWSDLEQLRKGEPMVFQDDNGIHWCVRCHFTMDLKTGKVVFHG